MSAKIFPLTPKKNKSKSKSGSWNSLSNSDKKTYRDATYLSAKSANQGELIFLNSVEIEK